MPSSLRIVQRFFPNVQTVKPAPQSVQIHVRSRDCTGAQTKAHDACAMARACKRDLHLDGAVVSLGAAYLIRGIRATRYVVPQAVSREIVSFDRGSGFQPGVYTLNPPPVRRKSTGSHKDARRRHDLAPRAKRITLNVRTLLSA